MTHTLRVFFLAIAAAAAVPVPGRVPKVYNALITSNQNLEPSKAFPVYQPVLHDPFAFPYQPVFYGGEIPIGNSLVPAPESPKVSTEQPTVSNPGDATPAAESSSPLPPSPAPSPEAPKENENPTSAPPLPPNTPPPIPLNEFGLPPQVLPVSRFGPGFDGFTQVAPFSYSYPSLRFYNPFDPFAFNPYANLQPVYRPLGNVLSPIAAPSSEKEVSITPNSGSVGPAPQPESGSPESPPPADLNTLNVFNYAPKDPAIPNVPPPPLPQSEAKSNDAE